MKKMKCNNCGALVKGKFCEYCGTKNENINPSSNETTKQGNWPVALFIEDEYIDEDTNTGIVECFAYDIATESETDTISGKEECLKELSTQIHEFIADEEVNTPTEAQIEKDSYVKKLSKKYKLEIVYLEI